MMTVIALIVAALAKAFMDAEADTGGKALTSAEKWAVSDGGQFLPSNWPIWVPGFIRPKYKEKFFLSSTLFVAFTKEDDWHKYQLVFLTMIFLAVISYTPIINRWADFLMFSVGFRMIFETMYRKLRK